MRLRMCRDGREYEGGAEEIVQQMQEATPSAAWLSRVEFIEAASRMFGIEPLSRGWTLAERAEAFVAVLLQEGLADEVPPRAWTC